MRWDSKVWDFESDLTGLVPLEISRSFAAKLCSKYQIVHILIFEMEKALMWGNYMGLGIMKAWDYYYFFTFCFELGYS